MTKYDRFLLNAEHCIRSAKATEAPEVRESWLNLAGAWLDMIPDGFMFDSVIRHEIKSDGKPTSH